MNREQGHLTMALLTFGPVNPMLVGSFLKAKKKLWKRAAFCLESSSPRKWPVGQGNPAVQRVQDVALEAGPKREARDCITQDLLEKPSDGLI